MPNVISMLVVGYIWRFMFNRDGTLSDNRWDFFLK